MNFAYEALDRGLIPDVALRAAIRALNAQRIRSLPSPSHPSSYGKHIEEKLKYVESLKSSEIAIETDKANEQHYEVDTGFMMSTLGKRGKYSCCLYETGKETLDQAEEAMLNSYCEKALLKDGQDVLDLGCGWGSLCLFLAEKYPNSRIKALSNSKTQKIHIDSVARQKGFMNLQVFTGDVKTYNFPEQIKFDRILSIEMFEHMKNYSLLFAKVSSWLKKSAKPATVDPSSGLSSDADLAARSLIFIHIFCHRTTPYHFEEGDGWMQKHFFTGGTMPCHDLFLHFQRDVTLQKMWWVNGNHYAKTCEDWLKRQDGSNRKGEAIKLLREDAKKKGMDEMEGEKCFYRFRVFYLACAEFFATRNGEEWGVGHYLFSGKD